MQATQRTAIQQLQQIFQTLPGSFVFFDEMINGHLRF
jgi:hypothetical protein